jgi:hypothetical protein
VFIAQPATMEAAMKTVTAMGGIVALAATLGLACGSSAAFNEPTVKTNPPPTELLAEFAEVELAPMTIGPNAAGQDDDGRVLAKVDELLRTRTQHFVTNWGKDAASPPKFGKLRISPEITELRFVTRGQRIWAGAMYGNSAIVAQVSFLHVDSDTVVAQPIFFVRATAMGGSYGAQDAAMLERVAEMMADYIFDNYDRQVGSPTGVE